MALLSIYSIAIVAYRIYEPTDVENVSTTSNLLNYNSLREYTLSSGDGSKHYYFFYSSVDNNCVYVNDTVLRAVAKDTSTDLYSLIETVDITSLDQSFTTNRITAEWGIHSWPAFVAVSVEDSSIIIDNTLEWNSESPMTTTDIKQWLTANNIVQ